MATELTAGQLRKLLAREPQVFWFEADQSSAERASLMESVPPDVRKVVLMIMKNEILQYCDPSELENDSLLYYMATDEELEGDEHALRQHSDDWRLILFSDERGFLCDFNGWPGDNEHGAGVYFDGETGKETMVFVNGDALLSCELEDPECETLIETYEEIRQSLGKE